LPALELTFFICAAVLFLSILASKISARVGLPSLFLFIVIGMLAGSDGLQIIWFENYALAYNISVLALAFILFAGGLETSTDEIKPVLKSGLVLSSLGVFLTAIFVGVFAHIVTGISLQSGMLIGAIVSSTDAAAVFGILRSRALHIPARLRYLLEFESGSNDPMAVFLTMGLISLYTDPEAGVLSVLLLFAGQVVVGGLMGWLLGRLAVHLLHRFRLEYEGLYPILTIACVLAIFSATSILHGSGFLAVYIAGIIIGNSSFTHRRSILRFHNAISWLFQIVTFFTLGLLVFPSHLPDVAAVAIAISLFLIFLARPLAVGISVFPFKMPFREYFFTSWVGLKGIVPIVLAIFPLFYAVEGAQYVFNVVFFVVLFSLILQGTTIPWVARTLKLVQPSGNRQDHPFIFEASHELTSDMVEYELHDCSHVIGKQLKEIRLPEGTLVALVGRRGQYTIPKGDSVLEKGDTIFVLAPKSRIEELQQHLFMDKDGAIIKT
jgi:cell volume regulation protein A